MDRFRGHIGGNIGKVYWYDLVAKSAFSVQNRIITNTEKPCVAGSIPALSTVFCPKMGYSHGI